MKKQNNTRNGGSALLLLRSNTQAEKAASFLRRSGTNASVERVTGKRGCSFAVRVFDNPERVCRLLSAIGVACVEIRR